MKRQKYLYSDTDRHGNQRLYFRPPTWAKKVRIKFAKGTKEANREYDRLFALYEAGHIPENTGKRVSVNSIEWMLRKYQDSRTFQDLARNTRSQRANFYTRFCRVHGSVEFAEITAKDIAATRDALPRGSGRNFVKAMRAAYKWACKPENDIATENPAAAVSLPSGKTEGFTPWTLEELQTFLARFPKGHNARIAALAILATGQRVSDVRQLGRKDVREGFIRLQQVKTGATVEIPVLPMLKDELGDRYNNRYWLVTNRGEPYSQKSISMRMSKWAKSAGLEGRTAHGLRKSVGGILGDLGMSENIIMSVLGHTTSSEAQLYVRSANRRALAEQGMNALSDKVAHLFKSG